MKLRIETDLTSGGTEVWLGDRAILGLRKLELYLEVDKPGVLRLVQCRSGVNGVHEVEGKARSLKEVERLLEDYPQGFRKSITVQMGGRGDERRTM